MFFDRYTAADFNFLAIEYIHQELLTKVKDIFIKHNIFTIQDDDSIMCGFYCIAFIEYMIVGKNLLNSTSSFSHLKTNMPKKVSLDFRLKNKRNRKLFFR